MTKGKEKRGDRRNEERTEKNGRRNGEKGEREGRQMEINGPYKSNSVNSPEWEEMEAEEEGEEIDV